MADVPMTIGNFQQNEQWIEQEVVDSIIDSYWQVHSTLSIEAVTDEQTELDSIAVCKNISSSCCTLSVNVRILRNKNGC